MEAKKFKSTEQLYFILARSRFFVEKYEECLKYCTEGMKEIKNSDKLKALAERAQEELKKEKSRIAEISTLQTM